MEKPYRKLHDVEPNTVILRYAFIITFVVGVTGSLFFKWLDVHPLFSSGYAAGVLIAYALIGWGSGSLRVEPENIGDNCYYLGFLFTLASLAFTLYQMADPNLNDGSAVSIPSVISGFGVALSSTIVGVFLRVLLMQMRPDFVAADREMRADMNKSFGEFKKNLSLTLRQMKAYSSESVQMAVERDERIREDTELFLTKHHNALLAASKEFSRSLNHNLTEIATLSHQETAKTLAESSKKSLAAIETTTMKSLAAIEDARHEILQAKSELIRHEAETFDAFKQRRESADALLASEQNQLAAKTQAMEGYKDLSQRTADAIGNDLVGAIEHRLLPAIDMLINRLDQLQTGAAPADPVTRLNPAPGPDRDEPSLPAAKP
ncbi:hypothetical protein [Yoonia sp. BS5-3]|uniref:Uncharacterized protein n=1 Tax=Yoonia phaeophyticola TaxID=3137369 RepID=A0ABZ2VC36_9RHOB